MRISVCITFFNSVACVRRCLDSVFAQEDKDLEVIVVDNGSGDGTVEVLKKRYPRVILIENTVNRGASAARNQAILRSSGAWVLTLDCDAYLEKDFLAKFEGFLEKTGDGSRIGIVVPKILYPGGEKVYSLGHQLTFLRRFIDVGHGRVCGRASGGRGPVFGACAATALYRKDMLLELYKDGSCFDENLFFMAEDVDLAWRARKKGWEVATCYDCISYHAGNSAQLKGALKRYYEIRNRFLIMFKNDSILRLCIFFVPLFFYETARFIFLLFCGQGGVYMTAVFSAFSRKKRSSVKKTAMASVLLFALIAFSFFCLTLCSAQDREFRNNAEEAEAYNVTRVVKTVDGLKFIVEEDRPIEKVGGVYRPADLDSYVALKFNKLEKKIEELISDIEKDIDGLKGRIEVLESKVQELSSKDAAASQQETASP